MKHQRKQNWEPQWQIWGQFSATKHYHLSQPTKFSCQTKYTRCIYGENRNKLCVRTTFSVKTVCPGAHKPIKVSVCANLPMMWMCSFFQHSFLLQPLLKISESAMFWHLTTLDLWPTGQSPVSECLVSMRQIRGLKSEKMRRGRCFHTDCLYTWKLVIRANLPMGWSGWKTCILRQTHTQCGIYKRRFFEVGDEWNSVYESQKENNTFMNTKSRLKRHGLKFMYKHQTCSETQHWSCWHPWLLENLVEFKLNH